MFYQNWFDAGITKIADLLNQQGVFLDLHEFGRKFHMNVPFTKYYGVVNAIPKHWKVRLTNPTPTTKPSTSPNTLTTSYIYSCLLKGVFNPPIAESKILRNGFAETTIQKVYLMPFTVTKEVKIIMFQYKVIHNILPTCTTLYRDGLIEDATCNLCNATEQTLTHLLTNCVTIAEFCSLFQKLVA